MLITDHFILLNLPKTASTFARQCIQKAYGEYKPAFKDRLWVQLGLKEEKVKELLLPNIKVDHRKGKDQHGTYDQIPEQYKNSDRELVSIIRDPFTSYVSRYKFESWKKHTPDDLEPEKIRREFPGFPDLTLKQYIVYNNRIGLPRRLQGCQLKPGVTLGSLSVQYIQMFCRDHKKVLSNIDRNYRQNGLFEDHFPEIHFLKTENINNELYDYLLGKGLPPEKIQFIKEKDKVNVSTEKPAREYLNQEIVDTILELEWLLFDLFPEYREGLRTE